MKELFGTQIQQSTNNLADIYYMSCETSQCVPISKKNILRPTKTLILAVAMSLGSEAYASDSQNIELQHEQVQIEKFQPFRYANIVRSSNDLEMRVNVSPSVSKLTPSKLRNMESTYEKNVLSQKLLDSYRKNSNGVELPYKALAIMRKTNSLLADLDFQDAILQYDSFDEAWHYNLYFDKNIELSIGIYMDEIEDADFSLYHNDELLVSNYLPLKSLVVKMKSIISRV